MASPRVESEWPSAGAQAEGGGSSQPALPGVLGAPERTVTIGGHDYTVPPQASLQAALAKARTKGTWRLVSWQPDLQQWWVPSRTTPSVVYWLAVRKGTARGDPWWARLECNCDAERSGRYLACWHKAAVSIREQARAKMVPGTPLAPHEVAATR